MHKCLNCQRQFLHHYLCLAYYTANNSPQDMWSISRELSPEYQQIWCPRWYPRRLARWAWRGCSCLTPPLGWRGNSGRGLGRSECSPHFPGRHYWGSSVLHTNLLARSRSSCLSTEIYSGCTEAAIRHFEVSHFVLFLEVARLTTKSCYGKETQLLHNCNL